MSQIEKDTIRQHVRDRYLSVAVTEGSCCGPAGRCEHGTWLRKPSSRCFNSRRISGAANIETLKVMLAEAGFSEIEITLNQESRNFIKDWMPGSGAEDFVCSTMITAQKRDGMGE